MPMHGEYRMLRLHAELAETLGIPLSHSFVLDNGDSLTLAKHKVSIGYQVEHGVSYIDGKDINGLADAVMEDRKVLIEDGMMIVALAIDSRNNTLIDEPTIYNRGIITRNNEKTINELTQIISSTVKTKLMGKTNFAEIKNSIKEVVSNYLYGKIKRHPMIIPVIMSKN